MYAVKRPLRHPSRAKILAYLAGIQGVTPEYFLEVVRARKRYRMALVWRAKDRRRVVDRSPDAARDKLRFFARKHAGEGDLHGLLRELGMTPQQFCDSIPIDPGIFSRFYGFPMHPWPLRLLEYMIWANNMSAFLREKGYDPEKFKAKRDLPLTPGNRSPRTKEAGEEMFKQLERANQGGT